MEVVWVPESAMSRDTGARIIIAKSLAATIAHQLARGWRDSAEQVVLSIRGEEMYKAVRLVLEIDYQWPKVAPFITELESRPDFAKLIASNAFN